MSAPDIRDVPCGSCVDGYSGSHACDEPYYCACDRTELHISYSALRGAKAGRDLRQYDVLVDRDYRGQWVNRTVGEDIPAGSKLYVHRNGKIYGHEEPLP